VGTKATQEYQWEGFDEVMFQLRIDDMVRGTYYWITSIVFPMTISLFSRIAYACADLHLN